MQTKALGWLFLVLGAVLQVGMNLCIVEADGWHHLEWFVLSLVFFLAAIIALNKGLDRGIQMSIGYSAWMGLGVVGTVAATAALGMEAADLKLVLCVMVILAGVIGLKLVGDEKPAEKKA